MVKYKNVKDAPFLVCESPLDKCKESLLHLFSSFDQILSLIPQTDGLSRGFF
jgi:hypothetical protein